MKFLLYIWLLGVASLGGIREVEAVEGPIAAPPPEIERSLADLSSDDPARQEV
jgi:hypothetical protein